MKYLVLLLLLPVSVILFILSSGQLFTWLSRYRSVRIAAGIFAVLSAMLMLRDFLPAEVNAQLNDTWSRIRGLATLQACSAGQRRDDATGACIPAGPQRPQPPPMAKPPVHPPVATSPPPSASGPVQPPPVGSVPFGTPACQDGEELWNGRCECKGGWYRNTAGRCAKLER